MSEKNFSLFILKYGTLALIVFMPFHAFFTTWFGTLFGHREIWQAWKEIVLVGMSLSAIFLLAQDRELSRAIFSRRINQFICAYALIHLLVGLIFQTPIGTFLFGIKYNLTFLAFFVLTQISVFYQTDAAFTRRVGRLVLITGTIVMGFGLLQAFFLPKDFLTHFGYGPNTIIPYMPLNVDAMTEQVRILSTIGGPIQLAVFLILPFMLAISRAQKSKKIIWWLVALGFPITAFFTYSRGPWIGMLVATIIFLCFRLSKKALVRTGTSATVILALLAILIASQLPTNKFWQGTILHSTPHRLWSDSSNSIRFGIITEALQTAVAHPLGLGPGMVGPATHYLGMTKVLEENYYLQVAIEVGFIGIALFLTLTFLVGKELYKKIKTDNLALALFASYIGILLVNMVTHWGWADSSTALVWWGLAGSYLYAKN